MGKYKLSEAKLAEYAKRTAGGIQTLESALRDGMSVKAAARVFCVDVRAASQLRQHLGIPGRKGGRPPRQRPDEAPKAERTPNAETARAAIETERPSLTAVMGVEPFKPASPAAASKDEVNRRELGGMVARIARPETPAVQAPTTVPAAAAQPPRPKVIESTWKVTVKRRLPAAELHRRLQALMALLTETEGDVQADVYVADIVEVSP